ncbi:biopolymer transporter TolR [Stenotrophomonas koreensis]|uniref:Biopolymer transporter TolR n=1 Tax=Stenotrophomonas koreensis TaxID=266128 RepID=A0A0R0BU61_9GAMM|nr:ExbD/TolR family protein [Stenotrophomonas koreensis]KRG60773.1 biopolymer transporter TolR [Stenotrophomonas koreensis]
MTVSVFNRRKRRKLKSEINVVPYIDVMLVLLIIFMVTTPLLNLSVTADIQLPQSAAKALEAKSDPVIVTVRSDGQLGLQLPKSTVQAMEPAELEARLAAMVAQDKQLRVFLGADAQVPYQKLVVAMDALTRAKVEKVSLVTELGSNAR